MAAEHIEAFRDWLRFQRHRSDAVGRFAENWLGSCDHHINTLSQLDRHLRDDHDAPIFWIEDRDMAWRDYMASCVSQVT